MCLEGPGGVGNRDLCHQASWDIQQPPRAHPLEEALESWVGQKVLSKAQEGPGVCNAAKRRWDGEKGNKVRQGQHSDHHKVSETGWDTLCGQAPGKGRVALLCPSSSGGQLWSSSFCQGRARGLEVLSHHLHPISVGFVLWEAPTQPCSP